MVNEMKSILPTHCIPTSVELFFFGGESFELVATGVVHIFLLFKKKKKKERERERERRCCGWVGHDNSTTTVKRPVVGLQMKN